MSQLLKEANFFFQKTSNFKLGELSQLLAKVLATNDRDLYLVFLDELEEKMPYVRQSLRLNNLRNAIENLAEVFPDVISQTMDDNNFIFLKSPILSGLKRIGFRSPSRYRLAYDTFTYIGDFDFWNILHFLRPIEVDNYLLRKISKNNNIFSAIPVHDFSISDQSAEEELKPIFEPYYQRVKADYDALTDLPVVQG